MDDENDSDDIIEESVRCKHSWEDCDVSYSESCYYCVRNKVAEKKVDDYYCKITKE